ncbi:MAG: glucose-1-phosphate adenylyltransferase, partial [bacterium]|nr:glucose-1-phosphate adenylyltransferase [bacterium]
MGAQRSFQMKDVLAVVMAGGKGSRLYPLTIDRAKPAVPFGGKYRIIDFTLSNCINSAIKKVFVLTQYKSYSLERHIRYGWGFLSNELHEFVVPIPPQQRIDESWYQGTADAIYQNLYSIDKEKPEYLLVLSGDHIYRMDYGELIRYHVRKKADVTVGALEIEKYEASQFGVIEVDGENKIIGFQEKPKDPRTLPSDEDKCLISLGVYVFSMGPLVDELKRDAKDKQSDHDFGKNVIPHMAKKSEVYAYNFKDKKTRKSAYWRDVGTLDSYWEANMDFVSVSPVFNLYDSQWPIRTFQGVEPPAKFVFAQEHDGGRLGVALDSIVCGGTIVSGGRVQNSVLGPNVRVNSFCSVIDSVVLENVDIGRHSQIKKAIIEKGVQVPPNSIVGYHPEEDARRFYVTESGIT